MNAAGVFDYSCAGSGVFEEGWALSLRVDEINDDGGGEDRECGEPAPEVLREHSFGFEVARALRAASRVGRNHLAAVATGFESHRLHQLGKSRGTRVLIYQRAGRVKHFPRGLDSESEALPPPGLSGSAPSRRSRFL